MLRQSKNAKAIPLTATNTFDYETLMARLLYRFRVSLTTTKRAFFIYYEIMSKKRASCSPNWLLVITI